MRWSARWRAVVAAAVLPAMLAACTPSEPEGPASTPTSGPGFDWVMFGDFPYGDKQLRQLPGVIEQINGEPDLQLAFHVGDIKGSGPCSTSYYTRIRKAFDQLVVPLAYTFGDNEWTDCAKPENGGYDPHERLSVLREVFVPNPGYTLGRKLPVVSQAEEGYPENIIFVRSPVTFAVFHAVGSGNGLDPRPGATAPTRAQVSEERQRSDAASRLIRQAFRAAKSMQSAAVVLVTQADLFPPTEGVPTMPDGYRTIVQEIAREARQFEGEVYLFNGDSHTFAKDNPLERDSLWTSVYEVLPAENLTRVTLDGEDNVTSYLKVSARRYAEPVVTWTKVPIRPRAGIVGGAIAGPGEAGAQRRPGG